MRINKCRPTVITSDVSLVSDRTVNSLVLCTAVDSLVLGWISNSSVLSREANSSASDRAINSSVPGRDANSSRSKIARTPPRTQICDWTGSSSIGWNSSRVRRHSDGGLPNSQLGPKLANDFGPTLPWAICRHRSSYKINTAFCFLGYSSKTTYQLGWALILKFN